MANLPGQAYAYLVTYEGALNSGTPAAEPEISLGAPLAAATNTHRKTRQNSRVLWTDSTADANSAQMAEMDPVVQMAQKNVLARHLPSHCETLARLGLRLLKILDIRIYGFPQTGVSSTRNDYFSTLGISVGFWSSKAVVSCARNAHFQKNVKKRMSPRWHQRHQEPPLARFIPETKTNVAPLCGQMRIFFAMPGQGLRPVITSVVTNQTFLVKCRLVRAKRSLSRHYKTASAEIVVWPRPNTFF